ncbi:MAG: hypothetical protein M1505_01040 [Patescibacteria group bacterium]|nr:hypothetical protein [Patescibacteria group bacterium]
MSWDIRLMFGLVIFSIAIILLISKDIVERRRVEPGAEDLKRYEKIFASLFVVSLVLFYTIVAYVAVH